jgi:hypothetical protein
VGEDIVVEVAPLIEAEDRLLVAEVEVIISPKTLLLDKSLKVLIFYIKISIIILYYNLILAIYI